MKVLSKNSIMLGSFLIGIVISQLLLPLLLINPLLMISSVLLITIILGIGCLKERLEK